MSNKTFKALMLRQDENKKTLAEIETLEVDALPNEDVLVEVDYSSVNFKDSLAVTGAGKIVLNWPMVPGIDLAGTVAESASDHYKAGDQVVLTGWAVGEKYWGGYSQFQRVKPDWLVKLPEGLDARKAMTIGTAGLTAMLCVLALEEGGVTPESGPVAVSGATGGVGSIAVAVLSKLGYEVSAISGKESEHAYLKQLGAKEIVSRDDMSEKARPLERSRWAGAIDTVGSDLLARLLAECNYGATVASTGLAGGFDLNTTVMPFILRNVRLQGVDSVMCPVERREQAWKRLSSDLPLETFEAITSEVSLEEVAGVAQDMLKGKVKGRCIVKLS